MRNTHDASLVNIPGTNIWCRKDTAEARRIGALANIRLGALASGMQIRVWPDTSLVTVSATDCHDPALEPSAFTLDLAGMR